MPRLFSVEDVARVAGALAKRHAAWMEDEHFEIGGRVEPGFVELTAAIVKEDGTFRYDIEVRVPLTTPESMLKVGSAAHRAGDPSQDQARDMALDFLGSYLDEYFQKGRETLLPLDLCPFEHGDWTLWARGDVSNPRLDQMADEIIAAGVPLSPDDPRHRLKG
jgi:hypothetical protein